MKVYEHVAVIGLDSAEPSLMFDKWRSQLPMFHSCLSIGTYGKLKSTIPPITVPAWMSMMTGKTPGQLGIYGFRNRMDYSYSSMRIAQSDQITEPKVWELIGLQGKSSIVLGVPLTYPVQPVVGNLISCFMTPGIDSAFTSPPSLKQELLTKFGTYKFDIENFRTNDKERLKQEIWHFTNQQFDVAEYMVETKDWNLFVMVEMGTDRVQHGFWQFMDEQHVLYQPDCNYRDVILDHYKLLDRRINQLLSKLPDETLIMIVSDHGAQRMDGGFCINQWLMEEGYLTVKTKVEKVTPFNQLDIDWLKTKAFADGGYYGRLFLNVKGRDLQGAVDPRDVDTLFSEIKDKLENMTIPSGYKMKNKVFRTSEIYPCSRNIPPDGVIYFDDLRWRSIGSVGYDSCFIQHNDSGPDGANHSQYGVFLCVEKSEGKIKAIPGFSTGELTNLSLYDIAPTILEAFGLTPQADMIGMSLFEKCLK